MVVHLRIALLLCDTPLPEVVAVHGDYLRIYTDWLQAALKTFPDRQDVTLELDGYDVVTKMEYPDLSGYDVLMLTGSSASPASIADAGHTAYDDSNPFIPKLVEFSRQASRDERLRIVGICFGHQILSIANGGECCQGPEWEIGVYGTELSEEGKQWWGTPASRIVRASSLPDRHGRTNTLIKQYVEQMHKDHVPRLPPGFTLLSSNAQYPVQSMAKLHPSSTPSRPIAHILTIQGHPEFTPDIVSKMVDVRERSGVFNADTAKEARRRLVGRDGTGGEGLDVIGWAIIRMMLNGKNQ